MDSYICFPREQVILREAVRSSPLSPATRHRQHTAGTLDSSLTQEILYFSCHLVAAADVAPHRYLTFVRESFCDTEQVYISIQV